MCGKVISGADYEQINSVGGGGFFKRTANFSARTESPEDKKGRGSEAAAEAVSPPGRISNDSPNGFRTNLLTARRPNGFRTIRSDRFRTVVRTYFGRLPEGVSDCHSEGIPPHRPDKSRTASRRNFRSSSRTRNVRPQPPYPNKRFSSAANLYPAFSTCASANSYEKMMKSRDSSYESV